TSTPSARSNSCTASNHIILAARTSAVWPSPAISLTSTLPSSMSALTIPSRPNLAAKPRGVQLSSVMIFGSVTCGWWRSCLKAFRFPHTAAVCSGVCPVSHGARASREGWASRRLRTLLLKFETDKWTGVRPSLSRALMSTLPSANSSCTTGALP
ncbi:hypothetical protein C7212DRAFT_224175, partial [Tuber magnatum]